MSNDYLKNNLGFKKDFNKLLEKILENELSNREFHIPNREFHISFFTDEKINNIILSPFVEEELKIKIIFSFLSDKKIEDLLSSLLVSENLKQEIVFNLQNLKNRDLNETL